MLQKHEWLHYCYCRRGLDAVSEQRGSESGSLLEASVCWGSSRNTAPQRNAQRRETQKLFERGFGKSELLCSCLTLVRAKNISPEEM